MTFKALARISVLSALVLMTVSLFGAGCGSKTTSTTDRTATVNRSAAEQAVIELLSSSAAKMGEVTSYRTESVSELASNTGADEVMPSLAVIECELVDGAWNKRLTSDSSSESAQEMYIMGDMMYVKAEGTWYCQKDPVTMAKRDLIDLSTPESIQLAVDNADEVSLVTEDSSSATCRLKLEKGYYQAVIGELEKVAADLGTKGSARQVEEIEKSIVSISMQVDITIDKSTGLFSGMTISMYTGNMFNPALPEEQMTAKVETAFSDYGKVFDIRLPEEAEDAELVPINN